MITMILSNDEIKYIMKTVIFFAESGQLSEYASKTIENETKGEKVDFFLCYYVYLVLIY